MSMTTALSGLIAAQTDIATTSNNIANVNTTGFRKSRTEFADDFYTTPLSASRSAIGGGTHVQRVAVQFGQGNFVASGNTLDLAIQGPGFFAMGSNVDDTGRPIEVAYSRAGAFNIDANGKIIDNAGRPMLTWPVATDGSALEQSISASRPVSVPMTYGTVRETSNIDLQVRMPSDDTMLNQQASVPPAPFDPNDKTTYASVTSLPITDAEGRAVEARAYFVKTASPDASTTESSFAMHVFVEDTEQAPISPVDGGFSFDEFGALVAGNETLTFGNAQKSWQVNLGGSRLESATPAVTSASHDGASASSLSNLEVDQSGTIWANYGVDERIAMGRVALANFANPQGLRQLGNSSFEATSESGLPDLNAAGKGGLGTVKSGMLERSNVDLTEELVSLISAQRNYQANAKAMETSSSLMQTIMNIRN